MTTMKSVFAMTFKFFLPMPFFPNMFLESLQLNVINVINVINVYKITDHIMRKLIKKSIHENLVKIKIIAKGPLVAL